MSSLDPRVNRLGLVENEVRFEHQASEGLPFEIFWLAKPGKPYEHTGIVHAPDKDLALVYAKEQYSRRGGNCYGLLSVDSDKIWSSKVVEGDQNAFDTLQNLPSVDQPTSFLVFTLKKRGKQHTLAGKIDATSTDDLRQQLEQMRQSPCLNLWLADTNDSSELEAGPEGLWNTLSEKQYRDAIAYKAGEKIKAFTASRLVQ